MIKTRGPGGVIELTKFGGKEKVPDSLVNKVTARCLGLIITIYFSYWWIWFWLNLLMLVLILIGWLVCRYGWLVVGLTWWFELFELILWMVAVAKDVQLGDFSSLHGPCRGPWLRGFEDYGSVSAGSQNQSNRGWHRQAFEHLLWVSSGPSVWFLGDFSVWFLRSRLFTQVLSCVQLTSGIQILKSSKLKMKNH